jgi:hypothetical protein
VSSIGVQIRWWSWRGTDGPVARLGCLNYMPDVPVPSRLAMVGASAESE